MSVRKPLLTLIVQRLSRLALANKCCYFASTSSITSVLTHLQTLITNHRGVDLSALTRAFSNEAFSAPSI